MSLDIAGRLTSVHVLAGRTDLLVFAVHANSQGGQFNCSPSAVSINGVVAPSVEKITAFVSRFSVNVLVVGVDDSQGGIGVRPCERVELTTAED